MNAFEVPHDKLLELSKQITASVEALQTAGAKEKDALRLRTLDSAKRIVQLAQNPVEGVFAHAFAGADRACVRIAVDLRIFHSLSALSKRNEAPVSSGELAAITGAEKLLVVRVMRVLCAAGFAIEAGEQLYLQSPMGQALTLPPIEAALKSTFDHGLQSIVNLPKYFRERGYECPTDPMDGPFQHAMKTDKGFFSYLESSGKAKREFDTFMLASRGRKPFWASWYPAEERLIQGADSGIFMVDIGGGQGQDLEAFKKLHPQVGTMVLQDLPYTVQDLKLSPGIQPMQYDFFTPQPVKGSRVYFYHYILHNWPDQDARRFLSNTAAAMTPGYSKLILNEYIIPGSGCDMGPANADFHMMADLSALERTEQQFTELLQSVGLEVVKFWYPQGNIDGVIEAMKPAATQINGFGH